MNTFSTLRRVFRMPPRELAQRIITMLGDRLQVRELEFPLFDRDVWDSGRPLTPMVSASAAGTPRRIGWLVVPPGVGSGGHTTLFRMVKAAQEAGFHNTLIFYDRYHGDFEVNKRRLAQGWPWLNCEIVQAPLRLTGFDAYVASSWQTAHVLASRSHASAAARLYFIQDYEPFFHPRGTLYALAEDTYRFGFRNISLGPMVQTSLRTLANSPSELVAFGTDRSAYRNDEKSARRGIVFFAKVNNDRRGYRLAVLALCEFQRAHPDIPINVYGDRVTDASLDVTNHGYLTPAQLNRLYNTVQAGLVLSFTNVSLIPAEMAAAGVIPVMNDYEGARQVFDNPFAVWAPATPTGLASALINAVSVEDVAEYASSVSKWTDSTWDVSAKEFVAILRRELAIVGEDGNGAGAEGF